MEGFSVSAGLRGRRWCEGFFLSILDDEDEKVMERVVYGRVMRQRAVLVDHVVDEGSSGLPWLGREDDPGACMAEQMISFMI